MSNSLEIYEVLNNDSEILEGGQEFAEMMIWYRCAIMEVETKLNVLNQEFSLHYDRNPFESIETRLKSPSSIVNKLRKRGLEVSVDSIWENLHDVAGVRVVCSFQEDIYKLARMLCSQDDVSLLRIKDYIKNPKPNGYRSLHLILAIPIFLSEKKKYVKVEVQFRTIAMDFWASLEHKMKYKKNIKNPEQIVERLTRCANTIQEIDLEMQSIRNLIEKAD
ncbi:MAG: GTP pyrophosphokinase family protein [Lachnospiraceae bacterium]|nr:GTP pyrophosphokinase family protein [Lachnospiraceae bacterium]